MPQVHYCQSVELRRMPDLSALRSETLGSLRTSAFLCVEISINRRDRRDRRGPQRNQSDLLRTPESAVECGLADRVAFARARFTGRAAVAADPVIALIVTEDIAAWAGGELRPTAFEDPVGCRRCGRRFRNCCAADMTNCRLGHARGE